MNATEFHNHFKKFYRDVNQGPYRGKRLNRGFQLDGKPVRVYHWISKDAPLMCIIIGEERVFDGDPKDAPEDLLQKLATQATYRGKR